MTRRRSKPKFQGSGGDVDKTDESPPAKLQRTDETMEERTRVVMCAREETASRVQAMLDSTRLVVIKGPIGSGKTHCALEAARRRGVPVHIIQLGDQYDAKTLFGTYNCTDVPGEFIWAASEMSKCLKTKCLLLLEDLDLVDSGVVASILDMTNKRDFILPGGRREKIHKECRIVATAHTDGSGVRTSLLRDYPYVVEMEPFNNEEIAAVALLQYPSLARADHKMMEMFTRLNEMIASFAFKSSIERRLNIRDFLRACGRVAAVMGAESIKLFHELHDVWVAHLSRDDFRRSAAKMVAQQLNLAEGRVDSIFDEYKPAVEIAQESFKVGRSALRRGPLKRDEPAAVSNFGLTRGSCQLMERIAVCIGNKEPVLLVGETGGGKTSVVQLLAAQCGVPLRVVNLSLDSDYCDLIGGYKPAAIPNLIRPLADDVMRLLQTTVDVDKNQTLLGNMNRCLNDEQYESYLRLVIRVGSVRAKEGMHPVEWSQLVVKAQRLAKSIRTKKGFSAMPFAYAEGVVTESARLGHWLLVDEINLASTECLDAILQVLRADEVHPEFRLFACMNPSIDVGKRALSTGIRSMFTEFFVVEPSETDELMVITRGYLPQASDGEARSVAAFYRDVCETFAHRFSLRTLCRALLYAKDNPSGGARSSMRNSATILFASGLSAEERARLSVIIDKHLGGASKGRSTRSKLPLSGYIEVEGSPIMRGNALAEADPLFVTTPSVRAGLAFLASVVSARRFPILLEGETSTGKTSTILHLAKITGNRVFRINNHEHTDVEEYIGGYGPTPDGNLAFTEGVLLQAVRNGDWIVLDELNLAPPAVLEVLNRLLDDNRELFVPEINVTVKAHPSFQLFATQNPAGSYAGRKKLSRAFLNRFVVIRCEPPPVAELSKIVESRCQVAPSAAAIMVEVMVELKSRRALSGIFSSSSGLMTMRDLIRWADRVRHSDRDAGDWRGTVAEQGYFLLGSRCRNPHDEQMVVDVLEKCLKRKIDRLKLFAPDSPHMPREAGEGADRNRIVLTPSMCRMMILCSEAWRCGEPILFVGATGCGKTTAAHLMGELLSVNCHERMETSDFLGSLRPAGGGKFRWQDGIVVEAMRMGKKLLIDEISLAPDSVLERMNSLLEPARTLYLTGGGVNSHEVVAAHGFQLCATMNPGNDHGKKELSKALRNRFTEVWCPSDNRSPEEMQVILTRRLSTLEEMGEEQVQRASKLMVRFFHFYETTFGRYIRSTPTIRDVVACAEVFVACAQSGVPPAESAYHALSACLLDSLGVLPTRLTLPRQQVIASCNEEFARLDAQFKLGGAPQLVSPSGGEVTCGDQGLSAGSFTIPRGGFVTTPPQLFHFNAPTTRGNVLRVARALVCKKPVMLEGSPGAGKSSLIVSLAAATGNKLTRLNLSEQTDLSDLFGSDVPCAGEDGAPTFEWRDGPVLAAIKEGSWVLLDEMNLASQSVLEGLNSCFDFRKAVHICDLNKTFHIDDPTRCRFFACQNPHGQGGDRRALPRSFLNRFTPIFIEELTDDDFTSILESNNRRLGRDLPVKEMIAVNGAVRALGIRQGGPFEFNLRDLQRWCDTSQELGVAFAFELVYLSRLRSSVDEEKAIHAYDEVFGKAGRWAPSIPILSLSGNTLAIESSGRRFELSQGSARSRREQLLMMGSQLPVAHKLLACVKQGLFTLLVGEHSWGKRSVVEFVSALLRRRLHSLRVSASTDSMELLGSYEQIVDDAAFEEQSRRLHGICAQLQGGGEAASTIMAKLEAGINPIELHSLIQQAHLIFPDSEELRELSSSVTNPRMRFEWVASDFVKAYRDGEWIIIEDVNCCSSAVLDCLNSCLESDGRLVLPESNDAESSTIEKHPEFRAFFTMDPRNGPLSRAMRNRAVEIYIGPDDAWCKDVSDLASLIFDKAHHLLPTGVDICEALEHPTAGEALRIRALNSTAEKQAQLCAGMEMHAKQSGGSDLMVAKRPQLIRNIQVVISEYYCESWRVATTGFAIAPLADYLFSVLMAGNLDFNALDELLRDCIDLPTRERYQQLMRTKTGNSEWATYSTALERLRFAHPFDRQEEHAAYVGLLSSTPALVDGRRGLAGILASAQVLLHQLSYILKVPTFTADRLQSMAKGVPWCSDESRDAFLALAALSRQASFQQSEQLPIDLQGLLRLPLLALILNKFLAAYGSGGSMPTEFTIATYDGAEKWMNLFLSVLWTLSFAKDDVNSSICATVDSLRSAFHLEVPLGGDVGASIVLLQLLHEMLPPKDFVDPVVQQEIQLGFWRQRLQIADGGCGVFERFLQLAMGQRQGEPLTGRSQHPVIAALQQQRKSAMKEVEELCPAPQQACYYRPDGDKFPQLLCSLRRFIGTLDDFAQSALGEEVATCMRAPCGRSTTRVLSKFIHRLATFLSTFDASVKRLEDEFSGYPDIVLSYVAVFNSISTCLNATGLRAMSLLRRNELEGTFHFPKALNFSFTTLLHDANALDWMLGESALLPSSLQLQVVRRLTRLHRADDELPPPLRSWILTRWEEWYKRHSEKKAQLYVYKSPKDRSIEQEVQDEEELEILSYLPDYSEADLEEQASPEQAVSASARDTLADHQLCELLQSLVATSSPSSEVCVYHPVMRVVDELSLYSVLPDENSIQVHHLIKLCELKQLLSGVQLPPEERDVYNGRPAAEVTRCVAGIRALESRVQQLREEFPENNVLEEVAVAIEKLLNVPANQPLMKLASLLEKLLTSADEWMKLADRAHSIREEMTALQAMLVDWRKMEVLCWGRIIEQLEEDTRRVAILSAWPILELLPRAMEQSAAGVGEHTERLVLMLVEWLHNSTLADFEARLFVGRLVARLAIGHSDKLAAMLNSVVAHFNAFSTEIGSTLKAARGGVDDELRSFILVIKYNDLNLWSVKQSTQKAHVQLHKILRRFKRECATSASPILQERLLPVPALPSSEGVDKESLQLPAGGEALKKIVGVLRKMERSLSTLLDVQPMVDLRSTAEELMGVLDSQIRYEGDDEEKEKQQGQALFKRRKLFFALTRAAKRIGFNSRRGLQVDSERLTMETLTTMGSCGEDAGDLVRWAVVARNVFLKRFTSIKSPQQVHAQQQLSPEVLAHLKGSVEFGLHWSVNALGTMREHILGYGKRFADLREALSTLLDNHQHTLRPTNAALAQLPQQVASNLDKMAGVVRLLVRLMECCPDEIDGVGSAVVMELESIAGCGGLSNPLVRLKSGSAECASVKSYLNAVMGSLDRMGQLCEKFKSTGQTGIYRVSDFTAFKCAFEEEVDQMVTSSLQPLSAYFPGECQELRELASAFHGLLAPEMMPVDARREELPSPTSLLLFVQRAYEGVVELANKGTEVAHPQAMDLAKRLIEFSVRLDIDAVWQKLFDYVHSMAGGCVAASEEDLRVACDLTDGLRLVLDAFSSRLSQFLVQFAAFFVRYEQVACHLLLHGFVNAIPNSAEEGKSEVGQATATGDAAGFGEGQGEMDATDDVENMEQVEGLKDDADQPQPEGDGEAGQDQLDAPIEMDDDFAATLQDIDDADSGEDTNHDEEATEGIEERIDWNKDCVEQPDERKELDPDVWEKPDEGDETGVDDEVDASGKERTGETAAAQETGETIDESTANEDLPDGSDLPSDVDMDGDDSGEQEESASRGDEQMDTGERDEKADDPQLDGSHISDEATEDDDGIVDTTETAESKNDESGGQCDPRDKSGLDGGGADNSSQDAQHREGGDDTQEEANQDAIEDQHESAGRDLSISGGDGAGEKVGKTCKETSSGQKKRQVPRQRLPDGRDAQELDKQAVNAEAMEVDEKGEEQTSEHANTAYVHINREELFADEDRHVVRGSTVEEALATRSLLSQLKHRSKSHDQAEQDGEQAGGDTMEQGESSCSAAAIESLEELAENIVLAPTHFTAELEDDEKMESLKETISRVAGLPLEEQQKLELKWALLTDSVSLLASELTENLRAIIEPSVASRLEGDYRSGKRLNMRRLIPYIASDYRKDRIWLRRTKRARRNYDICIAIDDSSSMRDEAMITEVTCQSLCLIERALRQLEVGRLSICKFGEDVKVLSEFSAHEPTAMGPCLLDEITFAQTKTNLPSMLHTMDRHFKEARSESQLPADQMLIIIGDARGALYDGGEPIRKALAQLSQARVTTLYVAMDNGEKSIVNDQVAEFIDGSVRLTPYMKQFPFPFYAVVRGVSALPATMSEAIRQWFEFISR